MERACGFDGHRVQNINFFWSLGIYLIHYGWFCCAVLKWRFFSSQTSPMKTTVPTPSPPPPCSSSERRTYIIFFYGYSKIEWKGEQYSQTIALNLLVAPLCRCKLRRSILSLKISLGFYSVLLHNGAPGNESTNLPYRDLVSQRLYDIKMKVTKK